MISLEQICQKYALTVIQYFYYMSYAYTCSAYVGSKGTSLVLYVFLQPSAKAGTFLCAYTA